MIVFGITLLTPAVAEGECNCNMTAFFLDRQVSFGRELLDFLLTPSGCAMEHMPSLPSATCLGKEVGVEGVPSESVSLVPSRWVGHRIRPLLFSCWEERATGGERQLP